MHPHVSASFTVDVHLGFHARSHFKVARPDGEPVVDLLVKIKASADLYDPTGVEPYLTVVQVLIELHVQLDAVIHQARLDQSQLFLGLRPLLRVVKAGDQVDDLC